MKYINRCKLKYRKTYKHFLRNQANWRSNLAWFFNLKFKKIAVKAITLILLLSFGLEATCYGLATLRASQNPITKREILAALQRTQIRYAESEDAIRLLDANNAFCLLLSSGKYLVRKEVAEDDLKLLRAIIHEDIEAIMQIIAKEDRYKYAGIKALIFKYFPPDNNNNKLPVELYVNHTIARAFEWLILVEQGIIIRGEIPKEMKGFIKAIEPIINSGKHNYFKGEFWDPIQRGKKIRLAVSKGMVFYQVAASKKNIRSDKAKLIKFLKLTPPHPRTLQPDETYALDPKDDAVRAYLRLAMEVAPFLDTDQAHSLENYLSDVELYAKDDIYNAGGGHYGYVSYSALRDLIKRVRSRLVSASMYIITLDDIKYSDQAGNKANSFILFKKLNLTYPDGIAISAPVVKSILAGDDDVLNAVMDQIVQHFLKEKPGDEDGIFLSVRSSPQKSMPGSLKTLLHVGCERRGLTTAIKKVASSWNDSDAIAYRRHNGISDDFQMGIIVQRMVRGFSRDNSCAGVVFSRDPNTGKNENGIFGSYLYKKSCDAIVSGKLKGDPVNNMAQRFPDQYKTLQKAMGDLENEAGYPQEVEFTIENGVLYFLQTRDVKFTPQAELRYLYDAVQEGILSELQILPKLQVLQERTAQRKVFKLKDGIAMQVIGRGVTSIPGAMAGKLAFNLAKASEYAKEGPVIIISTLETREEILMNISSFPQVGLITTYGGDSSHEAVLTRTAGIPAVVNAQNIEVDSREFIVRHKEGLVREGDFIGIDGSTNKVFLTNEADILAEDSSVLDAAFGIDISEFEKEFKAFYLEESEGIIKVKTTYEELLSLNVEAWVEFQNLKEQGRKKESFIANLKKHFLHGLLLEKAEEIGKNQKDAQSELLAKLKDSTLANKEKNVKDDAGLQTIEIYRSDRFFFSDLPQDDNSDAISNKKNYEHSLGMIKNAMLGLGGTKISFDFGQADFNCDHGTGHPGTLVEFNPIIKFPEELREKVVNILRLHGAKFKLLKQDVEFKLRAELEYAGWGCPAAFSPNGKLLVTSGNDDTAKVWSTSDFSVVAKLTHGSHVYAVAYSPDGKKIATGGNDGKVKIWDARSYTFIAELKGLSGYIHAVSFSPDSKKIVSGGNDDRKAKVWDVDSHECLATLELSNDCWRNSVAFSPDGKKLAIGAQPSGAGPGEVGVWDSATYKKIHSLSAETVFCFSSDSKNILVGDSDIKIINVETNDLTRVATIPGYSLACLSSDGAKIVCVGSSGTIVLSTKDYYTVLGKLNEWSYKKEYVVFSPNGNSLVMVGEFSVKFFDITRNEPLEIEDTKSKNLREVLTAV